MLSWFRKLFGAKAPAPAPVVELEHPKAPVWDPKKGPKAYFEYFVHEGLRHITWEARAYIPERQVDDTFLTKVLTVTSPADSVEVARRSAQEWGHARVQEYQP